MNRGILDFQRKTNVDMNTETPLIHGRKAMWFWYDRGSQRFGKEGSTTFTLIPSVPTQNDTFAYWNV